MNYPNARTYRSHAGITCLRRNKPRNRVKEKAPYSVSTRLEAHLRAWWAAVCRARNVGVGGLQAGFDYIGDEDWPALVHVGALAQLAGRGYDEAISKGVMGAWLMERGFDKKTKIVSRRNNRGRVIYTTHRTFYALPQDFHEGGLTDTR